MNRLFGTVMVSIAVLYCVVHPPFDDIASPLKSACEGFTRARCSKNWITEGFALDRLQ